VKPIASTRHTLILLAIFLGVAVLTAVQAQAPHAVGPAGSRLPLYLGAIAFEWLLFWATWRGLRHAGTPLQALLGEHGPKAVVYGLVAWPLMLLVAAGTKWALAQCGLDADAESARTVSRIVPHGALEIALWVLVSCSAGICEEFVFRGYLMRQFAAWFGGWPGGLLASSLVFALGHAYQGVAPVIGIFVLGVAFGAIALITRRLVPGMLAHALVDVVGGLSGG
jgi:membrane protease YdiL (CAAX protease family)